MVKWKHKRNLEIPEEQNLCWAPLSQGVLSQTVFVSFRRIPWLLVAFAVLLHLVKWSATDLSTWFEIISPTQPCLYQANVNSFKDSPCHTFHFKDRYLQGALQILLLIFTVMVLQLLLVSNKREKWFNKPFCAALMSSASINRLLKPGTCVCCVWCS